MTAAFFKHVNKLPPEIHSVLENIRELDQQASDLSSKVSSHQLVSKGGMQVHSQGYLAVPDVNPRISSTCMTTTAVEGHMCSACAAKAVCVAAHRLHKLSSCELVNLCSERRHTG